jgi:subtilisin family serine protease
VLSVTAVDKAGNVNSSAGAGGIGVAVAAPGIDMLGSFPGGEIETWEGSSAAAPIVTGLVALMRQADPVASANDIIQRVISTAVDLGDPGFDGIYGYGLIDPIAGRRLKRDVGFKPFGLASAVGRALPTSSGLGR